MLNIFVPSAILPTLLFAAAGAMRLWYAAPLIVSVSLVCAATRHEDMRAILVHAGRFALWIIVFMAIVLCVIQLLSWMQ